MWYITACTICLWLCVILCCGKANVILHDFCLAVLSVQRDAAVGHVGSCGDGMFILLAPACQFKDGNPPLRSAGIYVNPGLEAWDLRYHSGSQCANNVQACPKYMPASGTSSHLTGFKHCRFRDRHVARLVQVSKPGDLVYQRHLGPSLTALCTKSSTVHSRTPFDRH